MKTLLLAMLFLSANALAAPHLVADVAAGTATCAVTIDALAPITVTASGTTAGCSLDLATVTPALAVGSHTATMTASDATGLWVSASSAPFTFTKPAVASPVNTRLAP